MIKGTLADANESDGIGKMSLYKVISKAKSMLEALFAFVL